MAIKVGINGFGRIGRVALRIMVERGVASYQLCGINLRKADLDYMVYQVKYDSVFRTFQGTVERDDRHLIINGKKIRVYSEDDAANIPWDDCGAEYIIESTGAYCTTEKASAHFCHGARKVIISAQAKDDVTPTFVMGVNHKQYRPEMDVVSNASCTTNCLAPMTKVINDTFGIEQALMSTIHAATAKQKAVDARAGRDWRTGRSVLGNIIPSTTGAAKAVGQVIPELKGKMTGMSFRVPTLHGMIGIHSCKGLDLHTEEFAAQTVTESGREATRLGVCGLAGVGYDLLTKPELLAAVRADFDRGIREQDEKGV